MNLISRISRLTTPASVTRPGLARTYHSIANMATLRIHNSLKPGPPMPFTPIEPGKVSWYVCGPTVYDLSHLGHARNYVSTDIIRRILLHFFGFDVTFVMNFTDIDDKIILRARRKRLLALEKRKTYSPEELKTIGLRAFRAYASASLPLLEPADGSDLDETNFSSRRDTVYKQVLEGGTITGDGRPGDAEAKIKMHINNMNAAALSLQNGQVFGGADEVLEPYLDSLYKESIDTSDQTMFTDLTRQMEGFFLRDMDALNVLRPDIITRVTEYVPQIAIFVEKIVEKGFAYESEGSVYFDIQAFEAAGNSYARLRPESRNDKALQEEGEGSLSKNLGGKRNPGDFVLWKKSKGGEPYWPSKWGDGRPGWHIECSVMASDKLGSVMDLHSGGIDLAFPHHDNELAQSEAYYCEHGKGVHTWVNYFMHMGHLSISGSKMSKSLKNFQTIQDALETSYTPRGMRIVFLLGRWNDGVEVSPEMRTQAENWEASVNNFFTNTKSLLAEASAPESNLKFLAIDEQDRGAGLAAELAQAKEDMHAALSNSFDTPQAMRIILDLIKDVNLHVKEKKTDADLAAVKVIAQWVTKMVGTFGLDENATYPYEGLGWASSRVAAGLDPETAVQPYAVMFASIKQDIEALKLSSPSVLGLVSQQDPGAECKSIVARGTGSIEELATPYLRSVSRLRDELRRIVSSESPESKKAILSLTDRIRDEDFTNLGVYLDDRPDGQASLIKFVPAEELKAARDQKRAKEAEKARQKEEAKRVREQAERERLEKAKILPSEMFKSDERYSAWDADGIPTKMKDGSDVPKTQLKKLAKEHQKQTKAYEDYLKTAGGSA